MALKTVCVVPHDWTLQTYQTHSCQDGSHAHLSHADLRDHQEKNVVVILAAAQTRREKTVVQIFDVPEVRKPNVTKIVCAPGRMNRGLSYRVGPYLAKKVRCGESWAKVMMSDISRRDYVLEIEKPDNAKLLKLLDEGKN